MRCKCVVDQAAGQVVAAHCLTASNRCTVILKYIQIHVHLSIWCLVLTFVSHPPCAGEKSIFCLPCIDLSKVRLADLRRTVFLRQQKSYRHLMAEMNRLKKHNNGIMLHNQAHETFKNRNRLNDKSSLDDAASSPGGETL